MNLFSVPHTVTEDLSRQPAVTVKKITPSSVREFLRRTQGSGDIARAAVVGFFAGAGGSGGGGGSAGGGGGGGGDGARSSPRNHGGANPAPLPDIALLLELLEFCLSDCPSPPGERPPDDGTEAAGAGGGGGGAGAAEVGDENEVEANARNVREAQEARMVRLNLFCFVLVWFGLVTFGLVWLRLVWLG